MTTSRFGTAIALLLAATVASASDIKTIARGGRVTLEDHLVEGKSVLFFFHAKWCGGCRQAEPQLLRLAAEHADRLAVRKIDIVSWNSAVASQYRIQSIPHLALYAADGTKVAIGSPRTVLPKLGTALARRPARAVQEAPEPTSSAPPEEAPSSALVGLGMLVLVGGAGVVVYRRRRGGARGSDELWYVESASGLDGPYAADQLAALGLAPSAPVCRKRDATRMTLGEALAGGGAAPESRPDR